MPAWVISLRLALMSSGSSCSRREDVLKPESTRYWKLCAIVGEFSLFRIVSCPIADMSNDLRLSMMSSGLSLLMMIFGSTPASRSSLRCLMVSADSRRLVILSAEMSEWIRRSKLPLISAGLSRDKIVSSSAFAPRR